ncbi:MAG TPA: alpha-2-macroglobulin family protein [Thermoanaerobaculia bacterium]|nr:alpha-2-macroglobulin family protein [Thermoanaerobaculia bacterium]
MSKSGRVRSYFLVLLLAAASGGGAILTQTAPRKPVKNPAEPPKGKAAAVPATSSDWAEVDRLVSEQKLAEALAKVDSILAAARARGDEENWTRALVRHVQMETALHGFESAVRFLREEKHPQEILSRVTLDLLYADALVNYSRAYSWEIGQRERVETLSPDLKAWTREQIFEEARKSYLDAWERRAELGAVPVGRISEYLEKNDYPPEIRGTLRDTVSYLFADLLADTSGWSPAESASAGRLPLGKLLAAQGQASPALLKDPAAHPLEKLVAVLGDHESWHADEGRREAALEARLERLRRLHASFTLEADRAAIRKDLEGRLAPARNLPWWAMGMATLAELRQSKDSPDNLVEALAAAREGERTYPNSPGGIRCRAIAQVIEAPDYQLAAMSQDSPGRRSLQVTHKNVPALYFRAYPVDLAHRVEAATDYNLLPSGQEAKQLLSTPPVDQWSARLPATPDYKPHRTFVTPPLSQPGLYVVVASAKEDFSARSNRIVSANILVGNLVLVTRLETPAIEARVLTGDTGEPAGGAAVTLYRFDWNRRHQPVETKTTGPDGLAKFDYAPGREGVSYFLLARKGKDAALDANYLSLNGRPQPSDATQSLVYADRSIYRPGQTIDWKVLVFHGRRDLGRFEVLTGSSVTVSLVDANGQVVESKVSSTNSYGTASGEFRVPAGRVLGEWRITTSAQGSSPVRVEEYKRPTFEVAWKEIEGTARLNRPVVLTGSARYYFGLPVTRGSAIWRVTREPEFPWWWMWYRPPAAKEVVAQGSGALSADGTFQVTFTPAADERLAGKKGITYRYAAVADVTDEGGETRSDTRTFRVGFVGVEAEARSETAFFREGAPVVLTVSRHDLNGSARPGSGTWRVLEIAQPGAAALPADFPVSVDPSLDRYTTPGDRQRPRWDSQPALEAILRDWPDGKERGSGTASHDAKGEAKVTLPDLPPGAYRFRYETSDDLGATFEMTKDFVVAGRRTPLKVAGVLLAETSSVPAGGVARLLAMSGIPGQAVTLEIFRDGDLVERRRLTGSESSIVEIPVGEKDRGGFGARLALIRDHQYVAVTQTVFVPWDDKKLDISFSTFRDRLRPASPETWRVTVKAPSGSSAEAGAAELLAYMYDRSLDSFVPHQPPDPLSVYPNHASIGVERASVGQAFAQWVSSEDYGIVSLPPPPTPDRLKFLESYGIGGPGRRGSGGVILRKGAALAEAPAPAAARGFVAGAVAERQEALDVAAAPPQSAAAATELRSNFAETAFWMPHLLADSTGTAALEFTVPDSVTSWKVWVHAVTRDLKAGSVEKEAKSFKDLMVRPYVPRFLRESDRAQLKVVVNNASATRMSGRVSIEVLDADTNASASVEFGLPAGGTSAPFTADAGGGADVAFTLAAPRRIGTYAFKVTAVSGETSDGELRPVPVLPGRMHLVQSRFVSLKDGSRRTMSFEDMAKGDDPSRTNEQLVVTVDAQLFYSVLNALPYLVHYPYECTEQTLNRFIPTAIVSTLFRDYPAVARMAQEMSKRETRLETFDSFDPNRKMALEETPWLQESRGGRDTGGEIVRILDPRAAQAERDSALAKLLKAQTSSGGFPWWPGGPPSPYMTIYILHGFANALEFGADAPRDAVERAWGYVASYVRDDLGRCMSHGGCWEYATFVNYTLSSYPDPAWYAKAFSPEDRQKLLDFSFKHWKEHSPFSKAQLALVLKRMGRAADSKLVWDSVMDSAKTDPDLGTYWAREDRSWLWYNDTIETQALALRTLTELDPRDSRRDGIVQWLFLNKKLNQWKSTKATAEVVASLAHYLKSEGALSVREAVSVAVGSQRVTFTFEPDQYTGKRNQVVVPGDKLDPKTSSTVTVEKEGKGLAFASATWHFSTEKLPQEERGDFFSVTRRYFKRESTASGFVLKPWTEGMTLAAGDEVEVQISLRSKHSAEYIHLRDPRAAGLEPENVLSRYRWDLGISWYEETRDSGTNFFFETLPAGEYTFKYRLRANMAGTFRVAPAQVESLYAPEFAAYSAGALLTIR